MKISSFFYSFRQGLKNIQRNKFYSLASLATMIVSIFMFGVFTVLVVNINNIVQEAEESVAIVVYFDEGISDDQIAEIGDYIRGKEEVENVTFVSADEAWEEFSSVYFGDTDEETAESLMEDFASDNPLANSANYQVYLNDVSQQESLVAELSELEGVRRVDSNDTVADTLVSFNALLGYASMAIVILLFLVAVFLISNTVAVGISVRKEEIGIMKLIGATDFFIRAPFLIEGVLLGLIGSCVPLALIFILYKRLVTFIGTKFGLLAGVLTFVPTRDIFSWLTPVSMCIGIGIGLIGSMMTIRKHLRV